MSLIVGRRLGDIVVVVSDTVLTSPWEQQSRSLLEGVIKTRVMSDEVAISFAGSIVTAQRAFLELEGEPALTPEQARDSLLDVHLDSLRRADPGGSGASEFLIAVASPPGLIQIKDGAAVKTDAAWLGSDRAFRRFQGYATRQIERIAGRIDTAAFSLMALPDGGHEGHRSEQDGAEYRALVECMRLVIEDSTVPEVGGFVVPVGSRGGRMSYLDYASVVTHPLRFDLLQEPTAVPFGTAAEGGHAINLMSDQRSSVHGLALYVLQARAGAAFKQSDGLLRPTLIRDVTPIAFEEKLASEVDIVGGTFYGDPAEYCDRAMGHLQAGALDQALADAERAIARTDKLSTGFTCRGIVLAALGRLEDAVGDFNRALELNADDSRSLANRGATHAQLGDLVSALRDLDRSIALNPDNAFAFGARARVRRVAGLARLADQDEAEAQRIGSL